MYYKNSDLFNVEQIVKTTNIAYSKIYHIVITGYYSIEMLLVFESESDRDDAFTILSDALENNVLTFTDTTVTPDVEYNYKTFTNDNLTQLATLYNGEFLL